MTAANSNKDYRGLLGELRDQGWTLDQTERNHWKATPPDSSRKAVIFSETRDFHGFLNITRQLREQGFVWPPPSKAEARSQRRDERGPVMELAEVLPIVRSAPFPPKPLDLALPAGPSSVVEKGEALLFQELCDCKEIARLACDYLAELQARAADLQAKVDAATRDRDQAVVDLRQAKARFDEAFEVAS